MNRIYLSQPDVGPAAREALLRAFDSGWIAPLGPEVDSFELELADYVGVEAAVALSSGTAALQLGLLACGVQPGDSVVVQTATFAASAFAVVHSGAVPVFCDVEPATWCMDPALLGSYLEQCHRAGALPAAVMPVDLYGRCPDYRALRDVCDRFSVPIVEDAAEALGSTVQAKSAGSWGRVGALSFNGNKIMTTSGGGALLGPRELISHARYLATQARQPVPHYEHTDIGYNYRMSNLLAALGRAQLSGLREKMTRRRAIHEYYVSELPELEWTSPPSNQTPNSWLSVAMLPSDVQPDLVCQRLDETGIEVRRFWKPMHQQPVFQDSDRIGGSVASRLYERGICLPSSSALTDSNVERVRNAVASTLNELL